MQCAAAATSMAAKPTADQMRVLDIDANQIPKQPADAADWRGVAAQGRAAGRWQQQC